MNKLYILTALSITSIMFVSAESAKNEAPDVSPQVIRNMMVQGVGIGRMMQQIKTGDVNVDTQIKDLNTEMETKIKAIQDEYQNKLRAILNSLPTRTASSTSNKTIRKDREESDTGRITPGQLRTPMMRIGSTSTQETGSRMMNFFRGMFNK